MKESRLKELLRSETEYRKKLNQIVFDAIEEEKLLSQKLYAFEETSGSFGSRLADKIAFFGGSWRFIISFLILMMLWIAGNLYFIEHSFDPFPFILLNLLLSTIAALQAPMIMMSQNRKEERDRQRSINDYMINMKAEIEIRNLHQKLDLLMTEQMQTLYSLQTEQAELLRSIHELFEEHGSRQNVLHPDDARQANR